MVIVRTKTGVTLGSTWCSIRSLYWPKRLFVLPKMSVPSTLRDAKATIIRLPAAFYARKIGNELHVEVISFRRRLIFIDPTPEDFLILSEQIRDLRFDPGLILFSKLYLFFGDLLEDQKVKDIQKAIMNREVEVIKSLVKQVSEMGGMNDKIPTNTKHYQTTQSKFKTIIR